MTFESNDRPIDLSCLSAPNARRDRVAEVVMSVIPVDMVPTPMTQSLIEWIIRMRYATLTVAAAIALLSQATHGRNSMDQNDKIFAAALGVPVPWLEWEDGTKPPPSIETLLVQTANQP